MSFFDQILSCENLDMSNFLKKIYFILIRLAARNRRQPISRNLAYAGFFIVK